MGVGAALAATVLVHGIVAWWLLTLRTEAPATTTALDVTWIDRPPPKVVLPTTTPPSGMRREVAVAPADQPRRTSLQAVEPVAAVPPPDPPRSTASALLQQAGDWARQQAPASDFATDPLRHRDAPRRDGRFAMRDPVSAEDVVLAVGKLFGGGPSDPCPRIRRNIANLGDGGDRELLAEELRRLQRSCL